MFRYLFLLLASLPMLPLPGAAQYRQVSCNGFDREPLVCIREAHFAQDTCSAIERLANRHALDVGFFARLIWQESRFDPNAVSHAGAQGIAQFMPHTAKRRSLSNPFNPAEALDRSAEYLIEMTRTYGNLGLAAVGYNGGERRAEGLIAGTGGLARETRDYVRIITGMAAEDWLVDDVKTPDLSLEKGKDFMPACLKMAKDRRISPPPQTRPKRQPWGVQLAFGTSDAQALQNFRTKTRRCRKLVSSETPDLIPVRNRVSGRRGYVMARLGRPSLLQAQKLCHKLAKSGCVCRVYRNDP